MTKLKTLISRLSVDAKQVIDNAVNIASSQGHFEVSCDHLLLCAIHDQPDLVTDLASCSGLNVERLQREISQCVAAKNADNEKPVVFSTEVITLLEESWFHISAVWGQNTLTTLGFWHHWLCSDFALSRHGLACDRSAAYSWLQKRSTGNSPAPGKGTQQSALKKWGHNLTQQAREKKLDAVTGKEKEIRQIMDVLLRRRQNNPLLVGDPGVGKTALVEGVAQRIVSGDVPDMLRDCEIYTLDIGLLQAGASVKGEFEKRLQSVLDEVRISTRTIILFIDEAHMLLGAGGTAGQNDAANLLKPALSRGQFQVIGATTWAEYKAVFEKDSALARRFQRISVNAPDEQTAIAILRAAAPFLEKHHQVIIRHEAIEAAVRLSERYITDRQLPDKCLTLLDTACARVALSQCYIPLTVEKLAAKLDQLTAQYFWLEREQVCPLTRGALKEQLVQITSQLEQQQAQWREQQNLVELSLNAPEQSETTRVAMMKAHSTNPMVYAFVDATCVADVLSGWTGIPLGKVMQDNLCSEEMLMQKLAGRIFGQKAALKAIARKLFIARSGLQDPEKPAGVFMLAGPSGIGKTETALALADIYSGGKLVTINMSEYQEAHGVAALKGAPPGYVGYGKGGIITEAVRKSAHCVILLDEIEKAHADVMDMFYQILDKGWMTDTDGQVINFRNTLIIMTTNVASDLITEYACNQEVSLDQLNAQVRYHMDRRFKPALMGRVNLQIYLPLSNAELTNILEAKIKKIAQRLFTNNDGRVTLRVQKSVTKAIIQKCNRKGSGARELDEIIDRLLLPGIARKIFECKQKNSTLIVSMNNNMFSFKIKAERMGGGFDGFSKD